MPTRHPLQGVVAVLVMCLLGSVAPARAQSLEGLRATISWDAQGVPFITARDDRALLFAQGWAMAESRYFELKSSFATASAKSARFTEAGDPFVCQRLDSDLAHMQHDFPGKARAILKAMSPGMRELVQAFSDGINSYWLTAADQQELITTFRHADLLAAPVSPRDVVALTLEIPMLQLLGQAKTLIANPNEQPSLPSSSDAWAVGSQATVSGHALLVADPHLPLGTPATTFLSVLHGDTLRGAGCGFLGWPFVGVGTQLPRPDVPGDSLVAWALTTGPMDQVDVFELVSNLAGTAYLLENQEVPFELRTLAVDLPGWMSAGTVCDPSIQLDFTKGVATRVVKDTVFGTVLAEAPQKAWAVQTVIHAGSDMLTQLQEMLAARDLPEFLDALDTRALLGGNIVIATSDGTDPARHIGYTLSGSCPVRDDAVDWSGIVKIAAADDDSLAWDPSLPGALHGQADMPTVLGDVADHFLNNNAGIRATWPGFDLADYPAYMIGRRDDVYHPDIVNYRQDRARTLLADAQPGMTFQLSKQFAADISYNQARFAVPLISQAYTDHGAVVFQDILPLVLQLDAWLLEDPPAGAHVGSEATAVFRFWPGFFRAELIAGGVIQPGELTPIPFPQLDPFAPLAPPWPQPEAEASLRALRRVRDLLECTQWNVPAWPLMTWGDIHELTADLLYPAQLSLPIEGAPTALRAFQVVKLPPALDLTPFPCSSVVGDEITLDVDFGASCTLVVELDAAGPRISYMKARDNAFDEQVMTQRTARGMWSSIPASAAEARSAAVRTEVLEYLGPPSKRN